LRMGKEGPGKLLLVLGLILVGAAATAEVARQTTTVTTYNSRIYLVTSSNTLTSDVESSVVQPTTTNIVALKTSLYSVSIVGGNPACPNGGTFYASICTSLCGCQYNVCVSFDNNCANDYPAVYVGGYAVTRTRVSTFTSTSTEYTQFSTTQTYCTTLQKKALATQTLTSTRRLDELNPVIWGLTVTGALIVIAAVILSMRARRFA
jgi:hypothetical protein